MRKNVFNVKFLTVNALPLWQIVYTPKWNVASSRLWLCTVQVFYHIPSIIGCFIWDRIAINTIAYFSSNVFWCGLTNLQCKGQLFVLWQIFYPLFAPAGSSFPTWLKIRSSSCGKLYNLSYFVVIRCSHLLIFFALGLEAFSLVALRYTGLWQHLFNPGQYSWNRNWILLSTYFSVSKTLLEAFQK